MEIQNLADFVMNEIILRLLLFNLPVARTGIIRLCERTIVVAAYNFRRAMKALLGLMEKISEILFYDSISPKYAF